MKCSREMTATKRSRRNSKACRRRPIRNANSRAGGVAGAMTDMFRIVAAGREGNLDAVPDDIVRRLMEPDGDGEGA